MPNTNYYLEKSLSVPPYILAQKIWRKTKNRLKDRIQKNKDLNNNTHTDFDIPLIKNSYIEMKSLDISNINKKETNYLSKMYSEHRFDLLGSGWVKNGYDSIALGVEGYRYEMNVTSPHSSEEYEAIDWQKDYKSGFRWNEKEWYKEQRYGLKLGVDIKMPWELARLQHLPQLAIFATVDENIKENNIKEYKYQILDFIANNPPRMGVNWTCTMDVGIRVANMLVAYDLFTQLDDKEVFLDAKFKQVFANSVYEHGFHIVNNLEYSEQLNSNHYLSDIAGLLFVSAYLENSDEVNQWLAFSIQELIKETGEQFYEDGGNFESSTSYHRLSGELAIYSTALILALKETKIKALRDFVPQGWKVKPKLLPLKKQQFNVQISPFKIILPQWYIDRLYKIGRFTVDITKPNGEIPQIGDNDSGRFFRFSPNGEFISNKEAVEKYLNLKGYKKNDNLFWDENILDHRTFISAVSGLFDDNIFKTTVSLEKSFVKSMAKNTLTVFDKSYQEPTLKINPNTLTYKNRIEYSSKLIIRNLKFICYPDSGIYIYITDNLHLVICATPLGQKDLGGHTHNDKLSYELWMDGKDIERDAGTYLYTPLPNKRNEFRSVKAHNVPIINEVEQNSWRKGSVGLFGMVKDFKCFISDFDDDFIELVLEYKGIIMMRRFEIKENGVTIKDSCNKEFSYNQFGMYSNGYGKVMLEQ